MHQQEVHEGPVDQHVHAPAKGALLQEPDLENRIQEEDPGMVKSFALKIALRRPLAAAATLWEVEKALLSLRRLRRNQVEIR